MVHHALKQTSSIWPDTISNNKMHQDVNCLGGKIPNVSFSIKWCVSFSSIWMLHITDRYHAWNSYITVWPCSLPWWPSGLRRCHYLLAVSHHLPGRGICESCQWLGLAVVFAGYPYFFNHLQLASHDLAYAWQKNNRSLLRYAVVCSCGARAVVVSQQER